jgi:hypothetical protein
MARPSEGNGGLEVLRFLLGATVMIVTVLVFWKCLPRGGKMHRFVGTEWGALLASRFALRSL